jgi:hypothetical protein
MISLSGDVLSASNMRLTGRLFALGFAVLFVYFTISALRTGKTKPSNHDRVYLRSKDLGIYWFHVAVYVIVACAFLAAAIAKWNANK